ncbi:hypothetical protein ACH5RR_036698 [Cinchona calisaya]|uniref:Uncharacterized protein n=1 Tax=Cinchona calisaya TaxID=153742 RepID=A0ABD2Y8G9_9GENT
MAHQIQDSIIIKNQQQRSSCFLGCFGSSVSPHKVKEKSNKKIKTNTIISWFSWSKKSPKRTVPVDTAATEKLHQRKESCPMAKLSKKVSSKTQKLPAETTLAGQIPASAADTPVHGTKNKMRYENAQKIILENTKSLNHLDSTVKAATRNKEVLQKSSSSQTSSPEDKHEVSRRATAVLSHSASMPTPSIRKKPVANGGDGGHHVKKNNSRLKNNVCADKFDPFIGMSIIVVTLVILVVWGKLCAILCTSAWLYCFPLIKVKKVEPKVTIRNGSKSCDLDINSEEYKKKVVLEGFLDRNHRTNAI